MEESPHRQQVLIARHGVSLDIFQLLEEQKDKLSSGEAGSGLHSLKATWLEAVQQKASRSSPHYEQWVPRLLAILVVD